MNEHGEVRLVMHFRDIGGDLSLIFRRFDECEAAWQFAAECKRKAERRRRIKDRMLCLAAYYYGITTTGKTYCGMLYCNGQTIRPADREWWAQSYYGKPWFEMMERDTELLKP